MHMRKRVWCQAYVWICPAETMGIEAITAALLLVVLLDSLVLFMNAKSVLHVVTYLNMGFMQTKTLHVFRVWLCQTN